MTTMNAISEIRKAGFTLVSMQVDANNLRMMKFTRNRGELVYLFDEHGTPRCMDHNIPVDNNTVTRYELTMREFQSMPESTPATKLARMIMRRT